MCSRKRGTPGLSLIRGASGDVAAPGAPRSFLRRPFPYTSVVMRIDQLLGTGKPAVSFEFFPPKTEAGFKLLYEAIEDLRPLKPSYVSVTYGAGGAPRGKNVELRGKIQTQIGIPPMGPPTRVRPTPPPNRGHPYRPPKSGLPHR